MRRRFSRQRSTFFSNYRYVPAMADGGRWCRRRRRGGRSAGRQRRLGPERGAYEGATRPGGVESPWRAPPAALTDAQRWNTDSEQPSIDSEHSNTDREHSSAGPTKAAPAQTHGRTPGAAPVTSQTRVRSVGQGSW